MGVTAIGVVWSLLLIVGLPFGLWTVVLVPVLVIAASSIVARRRGRGCRRFRASASVACISSRPSASRRRESRSRHSSASRASLVCTGGTRGRSGSRRRRRSTTSGLDEEFFTTLPGPSYPPLVPVLDAAAFHVMGSPDVVTLHVQYWLFGVGFVWALAGLLAERVPAWILWPFVLLVLVAPRIGRRASRSPRRTSSSTSSSCSRRCSSCSGSSTANVEAGRRDSADVRDGAHEA